MRERPGGTVVDVRVIPNASKSALAGQRQGAVLVRLSAPPVDGRANDALESFLAGALDVPRRAVSIVAGHNTRMKQVRVEGVAPADVLRRLVPSP